MAKMGTPTKLTPETQAKVLEAISLGAHRSTAAHYAGIHYHTMLNWLAQGREQERGDFRDFLDAITKAEADLEVATTGQIRVDLKGEPRTALAYLARRFPKKWGEQIRVTVEEEQLDFLRRIRRIAERLGPDVYREVLREYLAEPSEPGAGEDGPARAGDTEH